MKIKTRKFEGLEYVIHVDTIHYTSKNYGVDEFDTHVYIETPENCLGYTDTLFLYKLGHFEKCNYSVDGYYLVNQWRKTPTWIKKELLKTLKVNKLLNDDTRKEKYLQAYDKYKTKRLENLK
jgi:hypothetical protein